MRIMALLMVLVLAGALASGQRAKNSIAERDTAQLAQIESNWGDAERTANTVYIESITAPEWEEIESDTNVVTRSEFLDMLKSGKLKFESLQVVDVKPRIYGNTAVVTGSYTEEGTMEGQPFHNIGKFTDVFVKRNGKWIAVATHLSNRPAK